MPEASLPTVTVLDPLAENKPLAPADGALNVTGMPATAEVTGQPLLLVNVTCRLVAKALPSVALCGVPAASVSVFAGFCDGQVAAPVPLGGPVSPSAGSPPYAGVAITAATV